MKTKAEFDAWVNQWMEQVAARKAIYVLQGMNAEDAEDRAVNEVRREIRRGAYHDEGEA